VNVALALPVVAQHPDPLGQRVVVGDNGAALAQRAEVLAGVEAEAAGPTHRPRAGPCAARASVLGGVGLARILDDLDAELLSEAEDCVHVDGESVEVDRDDGGHAQVRVSLP
jgi:hypothetical protein